jgi:hypothetical protein
MSIPIVNAEHTIVAWTDVAPAVVRNRLRHRKAEQMLGGPIHCVEIVLTDKHHLARAGAPRGWRRTWRCLALCSGERVGSLQQIGRFVSEAKTQSAAGPEGGGARSSPGED